MFSQTLDRDFDDGQPKIQDIHSFQDLKQWLKRLKIKATPIGAYHTHFML